MSDLTPSVEAHGAAAVLDEPPIAELDGSGKGPMTRGAVSWALYEGVRNPYIILITIYVFMPYFANVVIGDPVKGQAALASYGAYAGWIVAFTAPILGATVDRMGRRKPGLFLLTGLMVPLIYALWWTKPDHTGLTIGAVIAIATAVHVLFAYTEVFHNALLVRAAGGLRGVSRTSGLALALGNAFSVVAMVVVFLAFALPGKVDWPFVPSAPLFGLDAAAHEPDRIVAPFAAVLLALGAIPLFLFTPDVKASGLKLREAFRLGVADLARMFRALRGHRDAAIFLGSRMLYADGKNALLLFGGQYAAGVMTWGVLEMLVYGVLLSVFAVGGGFIGAWLDGRFGPKRAVQIEIAGAFACMVAQLGMGRERLFYAPYDPAAHAPLWDGPFFTTVPEVTYLVLGFGVAIFVTAAYASSRSMLTYVTPQAQGGAFFGLYALSGTATAWLAPGLVKVSTEAFGTQQAGFAPIAALLVAGFIGLFFVRGGGRRI